MDGGHTVVFERNGSGRQAAVITFANGRAIVGPFSKVEHGSTAYTGGRAILGAYVDRRIVKFCLAFEWVDGGWKYPVEKDDFGGHGYQHAHLLSLRLLQASCIRGAGHVSCIQECWQDRLPAADRVVPGLSMSPVHYACCALGMCALACCVRHVVH